MLKKNKKSVGIYSLFVAISSLILVITLFISKITFSYSLMVIVMIVYIFIVVILNSDTINKYLLDNIFTREITSINHMGTKSFKKVLFLRNFKKIFAEVLITEKVIDLLNWNVDNKIALSGFLSRENNNSIMLDKTLRLDVCYLKECKKGLFESERLKGKGGNGPLKRALPKIDIDLSHKDLFAANSGMDNNIDRLLADIARPRTYRPIWGPWTAQDRAIDYRSKFWLLNMKIDNLEVLNKYKKRADLYFEINEIREETSSKGEGLRATKVRNLLTKLRESEEDIFYNHHESKYGIDWFYGGGEGPDYYIRKLAKLNKACWKKDKALYLKRITRFVKKDTNNKK
jgi:hypothetical protein